MNSFPTFESPINQVSQLLLERKGVRELAKAGPAEGPWCCAKAGLDGRGPCHTLGENWTSPFTARALRTEGAQNFSQQASWRTEDMKCLAGSGVWLVFPFAFTSLLVFSERSPSGKPPRTKAEGTLMKSRSCVTPPLPHWGIGVAQC